MPKRSNLGQYFGTTGSQDIVLLGVLGLVGYIVYEAVQGAKAVGSGVASAVQWAGQAAGAGAAAAYHGGQVVTAPVADVLAWWYQLDDAPGVGTVLGNVVFPDGTRSPLSKYPVKTDGTSVYISVPPNVYQLGPNGTGNAGPGDYPAVLVVPGA